MLFEFTQDLGNSLSLDDTLSMLVGAPEAAGPLRHDRGCIQQRQSADAGVRERRELSLVLVFKNSAGRRLIRMGCGK